MINYWLPLNPMLNLPTPKLERWKYTHLQRAVSLLPQEISPPASMEALEAALPIFAVPQQVFYNGQLQAPLGTPLPAAVTLINLGAGLSGPTGAAEREALDALDTLAAPHTWLLNITTTPPQPLVLMHVAGQVPAKLTVCVAAGVTATLLEAHVGLPQELPVASGWQHTAVVIEVAAGATLNHCVLHVLPDSATVVATRRQHVTLQPGAAYAGTLATLGGGLVRSEIHTTMSTGCTYTLTSLACPREGQHHDVTLHTAQTGVGNSVVIKQRNLQTGNSHAVFQGKFYVAQAAQKTDAYMHCHTLLLSDEARVSIKPELEIYADDVKCSHGAASGGLNPAQLFYLQARGLNETQARALLVQGFADEFVAAFPALAQPILKARVAAWLHNQAYNPASPTVFTDDWLANTRANPEVRDVLREYGDTLDMPHYATQK